MRAINLDRVKEYIAAVELQNYDTATKCHEPALDQLIASQDTVSLVKEVYDLTERVAELELIIEEKASGNETPTLAQS